MNWVTFSVVFMVVSFVVIVGIDIFLVTRKAKATFSEIIRRTTIKWAPVIALMCFGMGLLSGHWWWSNCDEKTLKEVYNCPSLKNTQQEQ